MKKLVAAWKKFKQTKFSKCWKKYVGLDDWIALGIAVIGGLYYCKNSFLPYHAEWHAFYERIHVELIGIGITILILGNASQYIQIKQEKSRLILQMGSPDNSFAQEAVRQLRAQGWLYDGTTNGVYLRKANLIGVDLSEAHLEKADLWMANLNGSHMGYSHLERANLYLVNLGSAFLHNTNLKGVDLSNGLLKGANLLNAEMEGADLTNANLEGTYLAYANLKGTILRGVVCNNKTIWTGAKYSKTTQWPDGFNPEAAGCVLVDDE